MLLPDVAVVFECGDVPLPADVAADVCGGVDEVGSCRSWLLHVDFGPTPFEPLLCAESAATAAAAAAAAFALLMLLLLIVTGVLTVRPPLCVAATVLAVVAAGVGGAVSAALDDACGWPCTC